MRKVIIASAVGMGLLFSGTLAAAQTNCPADAKQCPDGSYVGRTGPNCEFVCPGGTVKPKPRGTSTPDKRAEIKDLRGEMREMNMERREEKIRNHFRKVFLRLDAAVERLTGLSARIESRITKLEGEGADVSKAKTSFADAKVKVDAAKAAVANAKTVVEGILATLPANLSATTTPTVVGASLKAAREAVQKAIVAIKAAHQALVLTVTDIKKGKNTVKKATTTITVTP